MADELHESNKENALFCANILDAKKAEDVSILDISTLCTFTDLFVIASGNNKPQIQMLSDEVQEKMHAKGISLKQIEGYDAANWILMDFGDIIVHIFDKQSREFYDLERIWSDADRIELE